MKERLIQLLDLEQLNPSKFADLIGVQRSSISHIISGRNKPSFDFLQKTLKAFPGLNASWLILGEGTMYEQMGRRVSGNLFDTGLQEEVLSEGHISVSEAPDTGISSSEEPVPDAPERDSLNERPVAEADRKVSPLEEPGLARESAARKKIIQVMVFYEDDTFISYMPSH